MGMGLRQSGKRRTLICLLLLPDSQRVVAGTAQWKDLFSPKFAAWVSDPVTITSQNFYSAPTDAELLMFRPDPTRCESATGTGEESEPSFSVNEFARLCAILYRDNTVGSSLIRSGLNLTRAQLEPLGRHEMSSGRKTFLHGLTTATAALSWSFGGSYCVLTARSLVRTTDQAKK
jgi:hypothetical protein